MGARLAVLLHDTHTAAGARAARYCSTEARRGSNLKYKVATRSARNKNRATGAGCTALRHTLQPSPEPSVWCSFSEPRRSSIAAARERLLCHNTADTNEAATQARARARSAHKRDSQYGSGLATNTAANTASRSGAEAVNLYPIKHPNRGC